MAPEAAHEMEEAVMQRISGHKRSFRGSALHFREVTL